MEAHRPSPDDLAWLERTALDRLARSDLSRRRLAERLEAKIAARPEANQDDLRDAVPALLDRLVAKGYVDDRRLAERLLEKGRQAGWSRQQIAGRLEGQGIDAHWLDEIERDRSAERSGAQAGDGGGQAHAEEVEAAFRIARKKRIGPFCPDPEQRVALRQRHLGFLARRGFSEDVAYHVIDAERPEGDGAGSEWRP